MALNKPQLPPDQWLLDLARSIFKECDLPERARTQTSTTLRRRFRGTNKSDLLGCFSVENTGQWLGDGVEKIHLMDMHSFQIVKPVIRANQSSMVQARVQNTVKPRSKNPNLVGVAAVGTGVYKYFNNHPEYWSNNLENQINQMSQTDGGYFIRTYHDPDGESVVDTEIDEYSNEPIEEPGEWACAHCGNEGPLFSEQMGQAENGTLPCLGGECDQMAEIMKMPEASTAPSFQGKTSYPSGCLCLDVVPACQVRIDEHHTKNGKVLKARWLEHHFLMEEDELQSQVPHFDVGPPAEWSFPLKWEYSLETGTDLYHKPWSDLLSEGAAKHEVRRIYMRPAKYRHYRSPVDFEMNRGDGRTATNRQGEPMLSLKKGQGFTSPYPHGFWFVVSSDRLLPWIEACDLRDEWSYGVFMNDAASFHGLPAAELNELQRTANNLWTIDVQHRESGSIVTTVYDREWFEATDFERQLSPTREGVHIEKGDQISNHYATVSPPQMNGAMEGIGFVESILGRVGGVQPATVGAPAKGEPYAAQRLQVQQNLGLLIPSQQSKAECKSITVFQLIKGAQRTMPVEWFHYIGTMYGEEWKDQDIEAFLNSNLGMDLEVWYKEGSEMPTSLIEQELKYRQFLLDVAQMAQFTKNGNLLKPEMLAQYAAISGIDYDVENVEADRRLAQSRIEKIRAALAENQGAGFPEKALVELAISDRSLQVWPGETHPTHIEVYGDLIRALLAASYPDYPLMLACVAMVKRHEEAGVVEQQTASASEVEGQAPAIAAQAAAAQAQAQAEAAAEQQKLQAQAAIKQQESDARLQREALVQDAEDRRAAEDRELEAAVHVDNVRLKEMEINAGDGETTVEAPESPRQQVAASTKYVDLPPAAQSTILSQDLGLPSSGTKEVHDATLAKATLAANKAKVAQSKSNGARK